MKISTSSIILATLAISSSSSSLAAPARDFEDAGFSSSSSTHSVHHCQPSSTTPIPSSMGLEGRSDTVVERSPSPANPTRDRRGVVTSLTQNVKDILEGLPVVGPPLGPLLNEILLAGQPDNVSPQEVAAFKSAVVETKRLLNQALNQTLSNSPVSPSAPVQNVTSSITNAQSIGDDPSVLSNSPAPSEAAEAVDTSSNTATSTTTSPPMPSNPPNTPSNTPSLSLPANPPANPPALPANH